MKSPLATKLALESRRALATAAFVLPAPQQRHGFLEVLPSVPYLADQSVEVPQRSREARLLERDVGAASASS